VFEQSVDASKDPYLSTIKDRSMRKAIVLMKRADLFLHGSAERKDGYRMALDAMEWFWKTSLKIEPRLE
jgi:hypothetical protein